MTLDLNRKILRIPRFRLSKLAEAAVEPETSPDRVNGLFRRSAVCPHSNQDGAKSRPYCSSLKFTDIVVTTSTGWPFSRVGS